MLVKSDEMDFKIASQEGLFDEAYQTGKKAAEQVIDQEYLESERNKLLLVLNAFDAVKSIGPEKEMLDGIDEVLGSEAPVVGGCAGDDWTFKGSKVFTNEKIVKNGVVLASLETDHRVEVDQRTGPEEHVATGLVTEVDEDRGGVAKKISGQPAAEWYSEQIGVPVSDLKKPFNVGSILDNLKFMMGLTPKMSKIMLTGGQPNLVNDVFRYARSYPMSDQLTPADRRIRLPIHVTSDNGLKFTRAPIYENLQLNVLKSDSETCRKCTESLYEDSDAETIFGFVADCANRWFLLNEEGTLEKEAESLEETFQAPFIGFYSYGELGGKDKNNCNFKNQTLTSFRIVKEN